MLILREKATLFSTADFVISKRSPNSVLQILISIEIRLQC